MNGKRAKLHWRAALSLGVVGGDGLLRGFGRVNKLTCILTSFLGVFYLVLFVRVGKDAAADAVVRPKCLLLLLLIVVVVPVQVVSVVPLLHAIHILD